MLQGKVAPIKVFRPSYTSLLLRTEAGGNEMKQATGFVIKREGKAYLISNGHVFSGKDPSTGKSDHCPDAVRFKYWSLGTAQELVEHREVLQENAEPRWLEHPIHGAKVDVAALPLPAFDTIPISTYDPWQASRIEVGVGDDVTVVGFPFGENVNALAIWTRASIASEHEADYSDLPVYLVDARTRSGQSGSPVVFFRTGAYFAKYGAIVLPESGVEGRSAPTEAFLGVYSGRVNSEADLGFVWRPSALREIIEGGQAARW